MRRIGRAAAYTDDDQASGPLADPGEQGGRGFDRADVQTPRDFRNFGEERFGKSS